WGRKADCLFIETAGLCLRCAPHIEGVLAVTVVDSLGGTHVPQKMGPMLSLADIVALTKGDLVSQAEREVIAFGIRAVNPQARILPLNGLLGTGILGLISELQRLPELSATEARTLRHDMPAAICSYCTGEKRIGRRYQSGNVQKLQYKAT
ncbi:MAG: hypothetical protein LBJ82_00920, partial [Deltaproteobacteria bacterium]|nr:hypothetical protein [Deltaproteobacteria bacterium]